MGQIHPMEFNAVHVKCSILPLLTPGVVRVFRYSSSPDRVENDRPVFRVLVPQPYEISDLRLLRFRSGTEQRELALSSGMTAFTFKPGFSQKQVIGIKIEPAESDYCSVTVAKPLAAGEYFFTFDKQAAVGWDFGVGNTPSGAAGR